MVRIMTLLRMSDVRQQLLQIKTVEADDNLWPQLCSVLADKFTGVEQEDLKQDDDRSGEMGEWVDNENVCALIEELFAQEMPEKCRSMLVDLLTYAPIPLSTDLATLILAEAILGPEIANCRAYHHRMTMQTMIQRFDKKQELGLI